MRTKTRRFGAMLPCAAACISVAFASLASAATTAPRPGSAGGFEVDRGSGTLFSGDGLANGATINGDDWAQGAAGVGVLNSDGSPNAPFTTLYVDQNWGNGGPTGADATQFAGQSNKNTDLINAGVEPWEWNGNGGGPQKNDLTNVYVHLREGPSGDQWIVFAAETRSENGDSHVDFEFNAAGLNQTGATEGQIIGLGPSGGRTQNDFVATVDLENGGSAVLPSLRFWDAGIAEFVQVNLDDPGFAGKVLVTANEVDIVHGAATPPWYHYNTNGSYSDTIANYQMVEIAVDLSVFNLEVDVCNNATTIIAKTRSSQSFTAELKDFALLYPFQATSPSCEITGPSTVCPGSEDLIYSVQAALPTTDELVTFLLGDGERKRGFDTNLDGIVTSSDLANRVVQGDEGPSLAGVTPAFTYEWTITGDATFCDGTTTATGDTVCVDADSVCDGGFLLNVVVNSDPCTSECDFLVVVEDTEAPVITCPADAAIECDEVVPTTPATATDNCSTPVITFTETSSGTCPTTITRVWTATDACGNAATCEQTITVDDTTPPVITCPPDATYECDSVPGSFGTATATDNCDQDVDISVVEISSGTCPTIITRTFTATDDCGNTATCVQTITIDDTTPPVITCPADATYECDSDPGTYGDATATDNCDQDVAISVSEAVSGTCPTTITRTFTATDDCGNQATCVQTITIDDTTPPVITCPADATYECDAVPNDFGTATATDNCDQDVAISVSEILTPDNCGQGFTLARTFTATDDCGNTATCVQTITVVDTTAPVIACPDDVNLLCSETVDLDLPDATDNCGASVEITYVETIDDNCPETTITRTFFATDVCGNVASCTQTISIIDDLAPTIVCPANATYECDSVPTDLGSPTITDDCSDVITVVSSEVVAGTCPTIITRTWTATDACGNSASCEQIVTIVDTTAPVITCPPDATVECDEAIPSVPATAVDNCDPNPVISVQIAVTPGNCSAESVITRTWFATDDCGNVASCIQTITVVDTTAPEIECPDDVTIECDEDVPSTPATATDNCDPNPVITSDEIVVAGNCSNEYVIIRTWTATDDCGNSATCDQIITVVDTTPPVITCPPDATIECDEQVPSEPATAVDNCDPNPLITVSESVTGECPVVITRVWTATDDCGNSSSCTQTITVVDTTPPVITCPPDATIECDESVPSDPATATDNCDPSPTVTLFSEVVSGECPTVITRVWTATDDCGNVSRCTQTITVVDTTPPVITCPADATIECDEQVPGGEATATDNCDQDVAISMTEVVNPGRCSAEVTIVRTFTATDDCGNSAQCVQTITVVDTTPPVITCPADVEIECDEEVPGGTATATDNCDPNPLITVSESVSGDDCLTVITRTYTATDDCGNSSSCTQTITIVDTTAPMIECPDLLTIECNVPVTITVPVVDNCDEGPLVVSCEVIDAQVPDAYVFQPIGNGQFVVELTATNMIAVSCWVTDACGNTSAACSFEVMAVCQSAEGCTPGYWKQPHHFDSWPDSVSPEMLFSDVFEDAFPGRTMLEVLSLRGSDDPGPNSLNNLGRHTVAALLNALSSDVNYPLSAIEVIDLFNATWQLTDEDRNVLKDLYANLNEIGCPLN